MFAILSDDTVWLLQRGLAVPSDTFRLPKGMFSCVVVPMRSPLVPAVLLFCVAAILLCGCIEPPIKEPVVTVQDIRLEDVSLRTMTFNTTIIIFNPNGFGVDLNRVAFDVYYDDSGDHYLGHGERTNITVKENGNTTVTVPVIIGNAPAVQAFGSLMQHGSLEIKVNGSAFIDVKVTEFEEKFENRRTFSTEDFGAFIPLSSPGGSGINLTGGLRQLGGLLGVVAG